MKRMTLIAVLVVMMLSCGQAMAADATVGVDLNSAYVWRGITFNDGAVAQPSLDVTKGNWGINVWGNFDIDDYDGTLEDGEFSEIDLTLSYSFNVEILDITVGYIEYLFPEGGAGTREIFASFGVGFLENFSAGADFYYDIDEVDDYYISLGLGYSCGLSDKVTLDAGVSIGIAGQDASLGPDEGFHDINLSLGLSYAVTEAMSIGAMVAYTDSLDDDVLPDQDTDFYGGINLYYSF